MSRSNVEIVSSFYDAFARGDGPGALALLADDIHWLEAESYPYADANPYVGPDAVTRGVLNRVARDWDDFTVEVRELFAGGADKVVAQGRYHGRSKATGKIIDAQVAHIWTVVDQRIVAFQQYADTLKVVSATQPNTPAS